MVEIDELPIPDWGLKCPKCGSLLDGLASYICGQCGEGFAITQVIARHRPILDIGLTCPNCDYNLTGLTGNRCPECGVRFSVGELLREPPTAVGVDMRNVGDPPDHHLARREPEFTGRERPLADYGLYCMECGAALAGATDDVCRSCGLGFEMTDFTGQRDWVNIVRYVPRGVALAVRSILYANEVPYLVNTFPMLYTTGSDNLTSVQIRVPRAFFFDAMYVIQEAARPSAAFARKPWTCPACQEKVPAGFEICWKCGGAHPDADSPDDVTTGGVQ